MFSQKLRREFLSKSYPDDQTRIEKSFSNSAIFPNDPKDNRSFYDLVAKVDNKTPLENETSTVNELELLNYEARGTGRKFTDHDQRLMDMLTSPEWSEEQFSKPVVGDQMTSNEDVSFNQKSGNLKNLGEMTGAILTKLDVQSSEQPFIAVMELNDRSGHRPPSDYIVDRKKSSQSDINKYGENASSKSHGTVQLATMMEELSVGEEAKVGDDSKAVDNTRSVEQTMSVEKTRSIEETSYEENTRNVEMTGSKEKTKTGEETRAAEETISIEEMRSVDELRSVKETRSVEKTRSMEKTRSLEETMSVDEIVKETTSVEEIKIEEEARSLEKTRSLEEEMSVKETRSVEEIKVEEEIRSLEETKAGEEIGFVEERNAVNEAKMEEKKSPVKETKTGEVAKTIKDTKTGKDMSGYDADDDDDQALDITESDRFDTYVTRNTPTPVDSSDELYRTGADHAEYRTEEWEGESSVSVESKKTAIESFDEKGFDERFLGETFFEDVDVESNERAVSQLFPKTFDTEMISKRSHHSDVDRTLRIPEDSYDSVLPLTAEEDER